MYLLIDNNGESIELPQKHRVLIGNDAACDIQIGYRELQQKHFIIRREPFGLILETFATIKLNKTPVQQQCMVETGEAINIGDLTLRIMDNEFIPLNSTINHAQIKIQQQPNHTAVFGLRSFDRASSGCFIIDDFHHPEGWHLIRQKNELHLLDSRQTTRLNGLKISQAMLSNGDVICGKNYKYKVEKPGSSGYSKFSPSHPRNVLLSEALNEQGEQPSPNSESTTNQSFIKNNLWWLTMLFGLLVLLLLIMLNK